MAEYKSGSAPSQEKTDEIALPAAVAGSGTLDRLVETARNYARAAASENTLKAYAKDWAQFTRWCLRRGADPLPPAPELIGLYIADLAAPAGKAPALAVSSIERRLSGLSWSYAQRGFALDRKNRHIATVLAGIRRKHARPPVQKEAILPEDIRAMIATLPHDLRGLRDRALLLIGFAGGLRRSEIVSLDHGKDDTPGSGGWVEILAGTDGGGALIRLRGKTGWREVEIGRGSGPQTCPVHALEQWLHFARIDFGPLFVAVTRDGRRATDSRLSDKHVARLIKACVRAAGLRPDLPEAERLRLYSGHSLRAGLASSADVDERYVQKQLGHASAEMTRRYQRRRDRFRVNLTKAAGL
ncbi:MAG: tyrosine-type recombinase/integrase [Rhodobacteraceae bacterium]|nr:tyrosine-type recombinase/integrase [Paracoccaceae bacterium]